MTVLVLVSVTVIFPESMRHFAKAGFDDRLPSYSCQSSGYFKGGAWTFIGIDVWVTETSFSQAKLLDLLWNWIVGRGLQFVLGLLSYKVFTSSLMQIVERNPISYDLFANLAFYATKADSLWSLLKSLFNKQRVRAKFILSWVLISTIYLTFVPSILDVMSGYQSGISTVLTLPNRKKPQNGWPELISGTLVRRHPNVMCVPKSALFKRRIGIALLSLLRG